MSDKSQFSRFSCDYCRRKKLRCSREKPKCTHCSNWTSDCVYSRDLPGAQPGPRHGDRPRADAHRDPGPGPGPGPAAAERPSTVEPHSPSPEHVPASAAMASTLSLARQAVHRRKVRGHVPGASHSGTGMLSDLYQQFLDSKYDFDKIKAAVRQSRREEEVFFIPAEPVGTTFIQYFLAAVKRGYPIMASPLQDLLSDIVFRPSAVEERGWVLMFNTILATAAAQSPALADFTFHLRWNAWLAADEASICMEPTVLNVQALTVFAAHGQDLVTPSLCWILLSQACRMAQMLKLAVPTADAPRSSPVYARRLCLFWSLFNVEKALSLSFGCPPVMATSLYRHIELPSSEQLATFRPHLGPDDRGRHGPFVEFFGAFYFVHVTKLALIEGDIAEHCLAGPTDPARVRDLRDKLDRWIATVSERRAAHEERLQSTEPVMVSIKLGFDFLTYRYHHLVVCLTRSDRSLRDTCVTAARAAIAKLKELVAHSEVFNGIVWQQLYSPFTPFFVLFGDIVTNPTSPSRVEDLQLLRHTVLYYLQFQRYHAAAVKLERVAETFTKIAEAYVRHFLRRQYGTPGPPEPTRRSTPRSPRLTRRRLPTPRPSSPLAPPTAVAATTTTMTMMASEASTSLSGPAYDPPIDSASLGVGDRVEAGEATFLDQELALDETTALNPAALFRLFSYPASTYDDDDDVAASGAGRPDMDAMMISPWYGDVDLVSTRSATEPDRSALEPGSFVSLREVEFNGHHQFSNCTFDWFALDKMSLS